MMRSRAHHERMLERARPRWPVYWAVPGHLTTDQAWLDAELRDAVRRLRLPHGCDVELTLLRGQEDFGVRAEYVVRIMPVPRRDVNRQRVARWLSDPAERTPK